MNCVISHEEGDLVDSNIGNSSSQHPLNWISLVLLWLDLNGLIFRLLCSGMLILKQAILHREWTHNENSGHKSSSAESTVCSKGAGHSKCIPTSVTALSADDTWLLCSVRLSHTRPSLWTAFISVVQ